MFAHLLLHAGFGHLDPRTAEPGDLDRPSGREKRRLPRLHYQAACCVAVDRFLTSVGIGRPPRPLPDLPVEDEATLASRWPTGVPPEFAPGDHPDFTVGTARQADWHKFPHELAIGVSSAATTAVTVASGGDPLRRKPPWELALGWFVSSYPLLGALAAGMKIVADADVARGGTSPSRPSTPRPVSSTSTRCASSRPKSGGSSWRTRCSTPPCATATGWAGATRTCGTWPATSSSTAGSSR